MNTSLILREKIDLWIAERGSFMKLAYLFRLDDEGVVTDETLYIYRDIRRSLPAHTIITKVNTPMSYCKADNNTFHEILVVGENLAQDYIGLINELIDLTQNRDLKHTTLVLLSAVDDDEETIRDIFSSLLVACIVYNNKKIFCKDKMYDLYYK